MNTNEKSAVTVYVVLSLASIVVLIVLLVKKKGCQKPERFSKCICRGGGQGSMRTCQNTNTVQLAYEEGILTENSDLAEMQRKDGGPSWSRVSPGDMNYPVSSGCPWPNKVTKPGVWDNSAFNSEI